MDTAQIKDWHAHVYFDAASRDAAWALRERIEKSFDIEMGRFHEKPVGPHPMFSYQVAFKNDKLAPLIAWLTAISSCSSIPTPARISKTIATAPCGSANRCRWCSTSSPRGRTDEWIRFCRWQRKSARN
jgi:hypothetical protein